jgi:hypothetical protein
LHLLHVGLLIVLQNRHESCSAMCKRDVLLQFAYCVAPWETTWALQALQTVMSVICETGHAQTTFCFRLFDSRSVLILVLG